MRGKSYYCIAVSACLVTYMACADTATAQMPHDITVTPPAVTGYTTYHNSMQGKENAQTRHIYAEPAPIIDTLFQTSAITPVNRHTNAQPTRLEQFYHAQTNDESLHQFGYDLLHATEPVLPVGPRHGDMMPTQPMGAVQSDYVVQNGDVVTVIFMGERKDRQNYTINTDGRLIIDDLPPVTATGKSLSDLRDEVNAILKSYAYNGEVDISIAGIRQIGILIAGHVEKPGRHNMNAFHSVIDALQQAGGIRKTGSLRQIKLIRQGQTEFIDLYALLVDGRLSTTMQLQDGDRIIVPPVGPTIAVTGDVKQPAIFELRTSPNTLSVSLTEALHMAGGILSAGNNHFTLRSHSDKGAPQIINMAAIPTTMIGDGGILTVTRAQDVYANGIELKGYSRKNGLYDLNTTPNLAALFADKTVFGDDIYPLIGVITRIHRNNLTRTTIGFSPKQIVLGGEDKNLQAGDSVYLFSHDDIAAIMADAKFEQLKNTDDSANDRTAGLAPAPATIETFPQSVIDHVRDSIITIQGAVHNAGSWPVGNKTDIESLIAVAGGLTSKADSDNIEIVSRAKKADQNRFNTTINKAKNITLTSGDQIRVNERFEKAITQSIRVSGEVKNPGLYDLMRGDTLLSVIERAGGLTDEAYAPGAIFSRATERKREESKFRAAAQDLERTVSVNLNAKDKDAALTPQQISMARDLADELRSIRAIGRVTVEANPDILNLRPELNLLVEGGDHLHIPKRPLNVRVSGEVMNPASLLFTQDKRQGDYLIEAGGLTYYADKSRIFIVYPDGSARPLRNMKPDMIIPGSTIIVPRDPKPFDFMDSFKDITQILANMAITGVFINDIAND